jgi:LacI family transcriptional regulator
MSDYPADPKRPTMFDVACAAGVSQMTVSRVVRGVHAVSESTVKRVKQAITELGYRPDPVLSALASYHSHGEISGHGDVLAFLDCFGTDYTRLVFEGARREGVRRGYTVDFFSLLPEFKMQRELSRVLLHRGIRGLMFGPSMYPWKHINAWEWASFAPVSLGALTHSPEMSCVMMDSFYAAKEGCRILQEKGCGRIGMVIDSDMLARNDNRWLGGYIAGLAGMEKKILPRLCQPGDANKLRRWARREKIDGVLTLHDEVWHALRPLGIIGIFLGSACTAPKGVIHTGFDPMEIGKEAVQLVHHQLAHHELGLAKNPKLIALRGKFVEDFS